MGAVKHQAEDTEEYIAGLYETHQQEIKKVHILFTESVEKLQEHFRSETGMYPADYADLQDRWGEHAALTLLAEKRLRILNTRHGRCQS